MNTATTIDPKNPPTVHEWTGPTGVHFRDVREPSGTYYHDTTPRPLIDALESAYKTDAKVRLFLGDSVTGRDWMEENDVRGTLGRSMGPIKVLLLLPSPRSTGGPAILCDCIVRLLVNDREVYKHPKYHQPTMTVRPIGPDETIGAAILRSKGYTHTVTTDGKMHANFKSEAKARRWMDFMQGKRKAP